MHAKSRVDDVLRDTFNVKRNRRNWRACPSLSHCAGTPLLCVFVPSWFTYALIPPLLPRPTSR